MRLSMTTRLVLVAGASTVLYGLAFQAVPALRMHATARAASAALLAEASAPATGPALLADCERDPGHFLRFRQQVVLRAHDRSGAALSGEARPWIADEAMRSALAAGPGARLRESRWLLGRDALVTGAPRCPLLVTEPLLPLPPGNLVEPVVLGMLLGLVVVIGTTRVLGVRPLQRRLAELAAAADQVGRPGFAAASGPPATHPDDLERVAVALTCAHTRILGDAALLQAQREAVERHLADVAHDVRTPVAALSLIVQAWAVAGPSPEAAAALREVAYLGLLLDNLHQETRDRVALDEQRTPVDAEALLERVGERFRRIGEAHGVRVETLVEAPGLILRANPTGLERALSNLIYNAILHGEGPVLLRLERHGPRFRLALAEAGPGPPERLLRAPEGSRAAGLGLGLRITREVVVAHGWTLRAAATASGAELHIDGDL